MKWTFKVGVKYTFCIHTHHVCIQLISYSLLYLIIPPLHAKSNAEKGAKH